MLGIAACYVDVASFIAQAGTTRCNLPDQDGVVRNRRVGISGPSQGSGKSLHGLKLGWKQAFDFLPGVLRNTGITSSARYRFAGHFQEFLIGSNLTHENERYYLVWPDMKLNTTQFEARYALGIRAKL